MRHGLMFWVLCCFACDGSRAPGPLPDRLATVVLLHDGSVASLVADLPRPGGAPVVRMNPGIIAVGPGWAHGVRMEQDAEGATVLVRDLAPTGAAATPARVRRKAPAPRPR